MIACCQRKKRSRGQTTGQTTIEYALLLLFIAMGAKLIMNPMQKLLAMLEKPIRKDFKYIYKYGDPKTCGFDDTDAPCGGSPVRHPRYNIPGNGRMFGR